ncbi:hypothetical protein F5876DRAFT_70148 [Lentinula aff. lateritia]|uniref:Uncharacterized protein n=1 Tax=Lentinula aff. lateritia TaxID=2804960 RepID=A0ACC1TKW1_9AGAR|nr:hypothetical protein F5876DRAFT_70148 [Lentinula aff. lateritia]
MPAVSSTTANALPANPPPLQAITTAISPHYPSTINQFEDSITGACVLVGRSLQQIQERNGLIVLPPPSLNLGNPILDANPDLVVAAAETRMDKAHQQGNFNALPVITFEGKPWDTEHDRNKPDVPSFPTPDLNKSTETWALWCIIHANIRDHPDAPDPPSSHLWHIRYGGLLYGACSNSKENFTNHFIDIVTIPDLYGQKLSELDMIVNGTLDFKANPAFFEDSNDVVKYLADCGITVDDMAEGFAYGQQLIVDKMSTLDPGSKEYQRYTNLSKRAHAQLQFTHIMPIENRTWKLPSEWTMDNILKHRRCKLIQAEYWNLHVRKRDAWRFARSGPVLTSAPGPSTLNRLAQGVNSMQI